MKVSLKQRNSFFMKTMLTYVLIFTIPFAIFGLSTYYWAASTIKEQTDNTYLGLLEDTRREVERSFNALDTFAVQLSYMPRIAKFMNMEGNSFSYERVDIGDLLNTMNELDIYKSTYPLLDEIVLHFNGKDTVLSTLGKDNAERFFLDLLRYRDITPDQWQVILSEPNNRRILLPEEVGISSQSRRVITYIQSLPPGGSGFQATLMLLIREESLRQMLSSSALAEQSTVYMADAQGKPIASVNGTAEIGSYVQTRLAAKAAPAVSGSLGSVALSDGSSYSVYHSLPDSHGWSYTIAVPSGTVLAKLTLIRNAAIGLSLFYLTLGIGLSYLLARRNYRPLAKLIELVRSKLMREASPGNEFHFLEHTIYDMLTDANRSEHEIALYRPLARNTCLTRLITQSSTGDDGLLQAMELLDLSFPNDLFACAALLLSEEQQMPEAFYGAVRTRLEELGVTFYWVEIDETNKTLLLNMEREGDREPALAAIAEELRAASVAFRCIGAGAVCRQLGELNRSYESALHALEFRFLKGDGSVIDADEYNEEGQWNGFLAEETQLMQALAAGDGNAARQMAAAVMQHYVSRHRLTPEAMRYLGYSIAAAALKALEQANIGPSPSFRLKDMMQLDTMEEMNRAIGRLYEEAVQLLAKDDESGSGQLIRDVKTYLNDSYSDQNLSLTSVAEAFRISPSYLSRSFKGVTGTTFIDYVNRRRIEASKPLLDGSATILQVAQQVGFDNDITFRRLFKKYMGITPSQFKPS